jgi:hypothetical protein
VLVVGTFNYSVSPYDDEYVLYRGPGIVVGIATA